MNDRGIHPRVSVNVMSTRDWDFAQDLSFYAAEGIPQLGLMTRKMLGDVEAGIQAIHTAKLRVATVAAENRGFDFLSEKNRAATLAKLALAVDIAQRTRSPSCYFISGACPSKMPTELAVRTFAEAIQPAVRHARERGVRLAIEHNATTTRETGFVQSLGDAVELARIAGLDVCVELQNCWTELHAGDLLRRNGDLFALVQISDFVVGTSERLARVVPGDGDMPLEWMLGNLLEGGYPGAFELEILGPQIEKEGYASAIRRGVGWISERLWKWGVPAEDLPGSARSV